MAAFNPNTYIIDDADAMAQTAADQLVAWAKAKPAGSRLTVALAGGSTPKVVYQILAKQYADVVKNSFEFFFGDVRMVPDEDKESNYAMARDALFAPAGIDAAHIHAIDVSLPPTEAAAKYEAEILAYFKQVGDANAIPSFDVVMLGFGPDGHTASLFPFTKAPAERTKLVTDCMPTPNVKPLVHRVTITEPLIINAQHVMVLARGGEKKWVLEGLVNAVPSANAVIPTATAEEKEAGALPVAALLRGSLNAVHLYLDSTAAPSKQ